MSDQLIHMEIIEPEYVERYTRRGYMTRDFFIGGGQYNWVMNIDIGDGAIARYGVRQGWPNHDGAKRIKPTKTDRASIAERVKGNLASALAGSSDTEGLSSPLAFNPGGVARRVDPKPTLDDLS